MEAANGGRWLGAIGLIIGLITGGIGSAAIGNYQYREVSDRMTRHEANQHVEEVEIHERLAAIETKLDRIYEIELRRDGSPD